MKTTMYMFFYILLLITSLSGCTNDIDKPSSNDNDTQEVAENVSYPTPAATLQGLVNGLSSDAPLVRLVSVNALEKYGDAAVIAVPQLKSNLYFDQWSMVRSSSASALGRLGPLAQDAAQDLIHVMENDDHPGVVLSAVVSLGEIGEVSAVSHLAIALYCGSKFYEHWQYSIDFCHSLAIESAEAISKLTGEPFTDAGEAGHTLNEDGVPLIVIDARRWWEEEGQYMDW